MIEAGNEGKCEAGTKKIFFCLGRGPVAERCREPGSRTPDPSSLIPQRLSRINLGHSPCSTGRRETGDQEGHSQCTTRLEERKLTEAFPFSQMHVKPSVNRHGHTQ